MSAEPLGDDELGALFSPLEGFRRVGLAVSGGPDSTALMHLFQRWSRSRGDAPRALVLTVDHGLRPEAADEAVAVARAAAALGLPHETLPYRGDRPTANVQALARDIRLGLLVAAAHRHGLEAIVLAHTRDDQAETVLLRLARGSGVTGLGAMATRRDVDGVALMRPLLGVAKARLLATLRAGGIDWIEDPSNIDDSYARVRMRALMPSLAGEGMTVDRLADTARRMARAADALETVASGVLKASVVHAAGFVGVPLYALLGAHEEIALRVLARLVRHAGGGDYAPRLDALEGALAAITASGKAGAGVRRTLGGAVLHVRAGTLWAYREAGRTGLPALTLAPGEAAVWDGRFRVLCSPRERGEIAVRALGLAGRHALGPVADGAWPRAAVETAPGLWRNDTLLAAAGFAAPPDSAALCPLVTVRPVTPFMEG